MQPLAGYHTPRSHPHLLQVKIFEEDFQRERSDRERMNEEKEELKKQVEKLQAQVTLTSAQVRAPPWPYGLEDPGNLLDSVQLYCSGSLLTSASPLSSSSDLCMMSRSS